MVNYNDIDPDLLQMFFHEAKKYFDILEEQLQILEKNLEDPLPINEIYRIAHSFKGMAGTSELKDFEEYFHKLESLISMIQKGKVPFSQEILDFFYNELDVIDQGITAIANRTDYSEKLKISVEIIENKINKIVIPAEDIEKEKTKIANIFAKYGLVDFGEFNPEKCGSNPIKQITITMNEKAPAKVVRVMIITKKIQKYGKIIYSHPTPDVIFQGKFKTEFKLIFQTESASDLIQKMIFEVMDVVKVEVLDLSADEVKKAILPEKTVTDVTIVSSKAVEDTLKRIQGIEVEFSTLDKLYGQFMELLIRSRKLESELSTFGDLTVHELLFEMHSFMESLQGTVLELQLLPIAKILRIFPRMVRNIAKQKQKEINFIINHNNIKIEQQILTELGNVINHLLRNSVDHGIESQEERLAAGKNSTGEISITTKISRGNFLMIIEDDGKGIDATKIAEKALKMGIKTQQELNEMKNEEIIDLIFAPNFSTAKEISNISGRGMGMNIVRESVQKVGGEIQIETVVHEGTRFIIKIPLSKSLISVLVVKNDDQFISIPLDIISSIIEVNGEHISPIDQGSWKFSDNSDLAHFNDMIIYDLGDFFNIYEETSENQHKIRTENKIIVINHQNQNIGLLVDIVVEKADVILKKMDFIRKSIKGVSGAAILKNGVVSLILNPIKVLESSKFNDKQKKRD
ncbi:Chemotaxis protein CheA [Candidatus Lokiarchaeum ossiferum]|uniref:Chemotaxis protein CheA n=1 Tax=Candidatus Lokiarchaeum ossiferum TaxID=2951803 RepID=A0ABY6HW38_9ARCH|nr:Chemotaxis protein CheA [Candidatus Lokiarchaeum sp. B-35]